MYNITYKKMFFFPILLMCCISTVKITANERPLTRHDYENIYRLKLDWGVRDLEKRIWKLEQFIYPLDRKKTNISHEIEKLKPEKFLSYHIKKHFYDVYTRRPRYGKVIIDLETPRLYLAYGLFPITIPITAISAIADWISSERNDEKIAEIILQKTAALDEIKKNGQKIDDEITKINQKIARIKIEQQELKGLDAFIPTYKPNAEPKSFAAIERFISTIDYDIQNIENEINNLS